jgi:hypothetical protein
LNRSSFTALKASEDYSEALGLEEERKSEPLHLARNSIVRPPSVSENSSNELNLNRSENQAKLTLHNEASFDDVPENSELPQVSAEQAVQTPVQLKKKMNQSDAKVAQELHRASIEFNGSFDSLMKGWAKKSQDEQ